MFPMSLKFCKGIVDLLIDNMLNFHMIVSCVLLVINFQS